MAMMETSPQYHGGLGGSLCSINDPMTMGRLSKGNSSEDTSSDDVDLDALVNGMTTSFPTYNDERPLLASTESLNNRLQNQQGLNGIYLCRQNSPPTSLANREPLRHNQNQSNSHYTHHHHYHHHHQANRHQLQHSNSLSSRIIPKPRLDREWRSKSMPEDMGEPVATAPLSSSFPQQGRSESSSGGSDGDEAQVPDPFPELGGCSPRWKTTLGSAVEELFLRQKMKDKKAMEETNNNNNVTQAALKVLSEDGTTKICQVDGSHRVEEICRQMVSRNHTLNDKSWSLIEELTDLDLERTLEDHESVLEVYKHHLNCTSSKLHFRKDFRKYEMFCSPKQFFPSHMVADPNEAADNLFEKPKRPRSLLLDMLSPVETLPEIQGWLHIREGHKRSWKKHFCVLRESGLYYSSKGSSKDPRHLNHFVQLSNVDIYRALNPKKKYHAPTEFMFCTKVRNSKFSAKDLRLMCAEDEKTRQCWLAALRLFKHGEQLLENYQRALERTIKTREESEEVLLQNMRNCSDRVAMDFSGTQGRVIDNPSEAIAIARQEEFNWRRRGGQRSLDSPLISPRVTTSSPRFNYPSSSGGSSSPHSQLSSSPRHSSSSPRPHHNTSPGAVRRGGINSGIHMTQPWFHSGLTRDETQALFAKQGMVDGMFLIRESQRIPGAFVLSFSHNQKVKHYQINMVDDCYTIDDGGTRFTDLVQLVEFYQLNSGGLPTRLLHVCTKL
ncbi:growth factor receptor-bound protein 14-like [Diadema antillarum]|uniref:growth factor receptor-bound protein 14-like n=1 Tax=Diadema antillarum TaxID=105358 RepID=UPI003A839E72